MNGMANVYEPAICPLCGGRNGHHIWAGTGSCPASGKDWKDAEIERLKEHIIFLVGVSTLKNKLITELCDALETENRYDNARLIQRAREAAR